MMQRHTFDAENFDNIKDDVNTHLTHVNEDASHNNTTPSFSQIDAMMSNDMKSQDAPSESYSYTLDDIHERFHHTHVKKLR